MGLDMYLYAKRSFTVMEIERVITSAVQVGRVSFSYHSSW